MRGIAGQRCRSSNEEKTDDYLVALFWVGLTVDLDRLFQVDGDGFLSLDIDSFGNGEFHSGDVDCYRK